MDTGGHWRAAEGTEEGTGRQWRTEGSQGQRNAAKGSRGQGRTTEDEAWTLKYRHLNQRCQQLPILTQTAMVRHTQAAQAMQGHTGGTDCRPHKGTTETATGMSMQHVAVAYGAHVIGWQQG